MKWLLSLMVVVALVAAGSNYKLLCDDVIYAPYNSDFRYELQTTGGSGRYGYQVNGLPEGLKNQGAVIEGIPKASGRYNVEVSSYDDQGNTDVKTVVINVGSDGSGSVVINGQKAGTFGSAGSTTGSFSGVSSTSGSIQTSSQTSQTVTVNGVKISSTDSGQTIGTAPTTTIGGGRGTLTLNVNSVTGATNLNSNPSNSGIFISGQTLNPNIPSNSRPFIPGQTLDITVRPGTTTTGSTGSTTTGSTVTGSTTITQTTTSTSQLAQPSVGYNPNYPTGSSAPYPTQQFPTGPSPNYISSNLPTQISNYQYTVDTTRDTYNATVSDVQSQAIFQRQINANKVVANLLSIITQLTANVNGVQADIPAATAAVNKAIADQRAIQQRVIAAENANKTLTANINTVRSDITTFQQTLTQVSSSINNGQGSIDGNTTLKVTITAKLNVTQSRLNTLQNALAAANDAIKSAQKNIDDSNANISWAYAQITTIQKDIDNAPALAASFDAKAKDLTNTITALEAQLADLRKQRDEAQNKSAYYRNLNLTAGAQIRQLQNIIATLNQQKGTYQPIIDNANINIVKINADINTLQQQVVEITAQLSRIDIDLANAQRNRDSSSQQYTSIVTSINRSTTTLNNLLAQVPAYNNALVQAYNDGNDANDRYAQLKGVLDALNNKYISSLKELNDAKSALEKARTEKEISDLAVNEQIRKQGGQTTLPYSIPGVTTGSTSTTVISASGPSGGRWVVSGSGQSEGTVIGTTSSGYPIIAGSQNTGATGVVTGRNPDGSLIIAGFGPSKGTVIGTTAGGNTIIAGEGTTITKIQGGAAFTARPINPSGDLTHYISNSLSSGVSSTTLYPFIMSWNIQGGLANFDCGASGAIEEQAVINTINPGTFGITANDGNQYILNVGSCTKL